LGRSPGYGRWPWPREGLIRRSPSRDSCRSRLTAAYDQRSLVQERRDLLPVGRNLHGRKRRRDRRFPGTDAPPRLSAWTGCDRDLADAVSDFALPGRWLRRRRLLQCRSAVWDARRFHRIYPPRKTTRDSCLGRSGSESHLGPASMVQAGALRSKFEISELVRLVEEEA